MFATWHRWFWLGGITLAILLIVAVVMNSSLPAEKRVDQRIMGLDFVAFYTAGNFVRTGQSDELYNLAAIRKFQKALAEHNDLELKSTAAWWNPPVYALVFAPLSALNFRAAYWTWLGINLACLAGAIWLLVKLLPPRTPWAYWGLVPLLICVSMPAIQATGHAQNSAVSLLILAGAVTLAIANRPILAGLVTGLLLYKPQIALAAGLILGLCANWRLWIGFATTAGVVLAINLLVLPGTLGQYVSHIGANLHAVQFGQTYIWERQATLGGFWRLLLQGREAAERSTAVLVLTLISQAILIAGLMFTWMRLIRIPINIDALFSPVATRRAASNNPSRCDGAKHNARKPIGIPLTPSPGTPACIERSRNGEGGGEGISSFILHPSSLPKYALTLTLSISTALNAGRSTGRGDEENSMAWMIVALTAMPLLLPYFLDYDLLLLAVPATLFARRVMANPPRIGTALWTALYACLLVNPGLGRLTHINLAVLLLGGLSVAMMMPCRRRQISVKTVPMLLGNFIRAAA